MFCPNLRHEAIARNMLLISLPKETRAGKLNIAADRLCHHLTTNHNCEFEKVKGLKSL